MAADHSDEADFHPSFTGYGTDEPVAKSASSKPKSDTETDIDVDALRAS
jgi:hypothetical protein